MSLTQKGGTNMKCPACNSNLRKVAVKIGGANNPVTSTLTI